VRITFHDRNHARLLAAACLGLVCHAPEALAAARERQGGVPEGPAPTQLTVPRVDEAPRLEDFARPNPDPKWRERLAVVSQFTQRTPEDGRAATQITEAYLGYDERDLCRARFEP
jgi:hypothetical protein